MNWVAVNTSHGVLGASLARCGLAAMLMFLTAGQICASEKQPPLEFRLVNHRGAVTTHEEIRGKVSLVFFGFTRCPDICPTQLMETTRLLESLGSDAKDVNVYFVSLDPDYDTVERLAVYLANFHPQIIGLTGPLEEVDAFARAAGTKYQRKIGPSGGRTVDHSVMTYIFDLQAKFVGPILIGHGAKIARTIASIRHLLGKSEASLR